MHKAFIKFFVDLYEKAKLLSQIEVDPQINENKKKIDLEV